jgi:hypothetical protein
MNAATLFDSEKAESSDGLMIKLKRQGGITA